MNITRITRGLTIAEVLATVLAVTMLMAIVLPALARGQQGSQVATSLNNLKQINTALGVYAADYNGRQPTAIVDDFSTYGTNGPNAITFYQLTHPGGHAPFILGSGCNGVGPWAYWMPGSPQGLGQSGNYIIAIPIELNEDNKFGSFRTILNGRIMHQYVGGKFYSEAFYAPNDPFAYTTVEPWFDFPCEFAPELVSGSNPPKWSGYCFSPAAMFDPPVLRAPSAGGYTNPYSYAKGFRSASVAQATHPALKTRILEHHWNQNAPENRCNPNFTNGAYVGCQPWMFNHGAASEPATLFFDGSTRLLPNAEVIAHDTQLIKQTGEGLWHRATPFGNNGYYSEFSFDGTFVSHHILTIDGILGRDTLGPKP